MAESNKLGLCEEVWYLTGLLRVMLRDGAEFCDRSRTAPKPLHAALIRAAEYPLRSILDKDWGDAEPLAKRNRSRLVVFDERVDEAISETSELNWGLLEGTLREWHRRVLLELPTDRQAFLERLAPPNRELIQEIYEDIDSSDPSPSSGNERDPLGELLRAWEEAMLNPSATARPRKVESFEISPNRLVELRDEHS